MIERWMIRHGNGHLGHEAADERALPVLEEIASRLRDPDWFGHFGKDADPKCCVVKVRIEVIE